MSLMRTNHVACRRASASLRLRRRGFAGGRASGSTAGARIAPGRGLAAGLAVGLALLGPAIGGGAARAAANGQDAAAERLVAGLPPSRERLASELVRLARQFSEFERSSIAFLAGGLALAREAVALDPGDAEAWRLVRDLATLLEDDAARGEALAALGRLDPADEVVQLARLRSAINARTDTVDERVRAYRRLLAAADEGALGGPVAARLALDLSDLLRRAGEPAAAGDALARATALDMGFPAAAAQAAGLVLGRLDGEDADVANAELLVAAILADPADGELPAALAELAGRVGAVRTAERATAIRVLQERTAGGLEAPDLAADLALAQWAAGGLERARRTLAEYADQRDVIARTERSEAVRGEVLEGRLPDEDLTGRWTPTPLFAVIRLAAESAGRARFELDPRAVEDLRLAFEARRTQLEEGLEAYERQLSDRQAVGEVDPQAAETARRTARAEVDAELLTDAEFEAYVAAVLLQDVDAAEAALRRAGRILERMGGDDPSSPGGVAEGTPIRRTVELARAFASGDEAALDAAIASSSSTLEALDAAGNPAAEPLALALGLVADRAGRDPLAGRLLARVATSRRGRLLGLLAADRLRSTGRGEVASPPAAERVDEVAADVLADVRRWLGSPRTAVHVQATFRRGAVEPFEPLLLDIELANRTDVPLAVGPAGPINALAILEVESNALGLGLRPEVDPIVVDLGTRLTLPPRSRLERTVDLRRRPQLGALLNAYADRGALVRVRVAVNHGLVEVEGASTVLLPRALGVSDRTSPMRIDGPGGAIDLATLARMTEATRRPREGEAIRDVALLAQIATSELLGEDATPTLRQAVEDARNGVGTVLRRLDEVDRAWLLAVVRPAAVERLRWTERVVEDGERLERLVWMASHAIARADPADAVVQAARTADDPALRRVAEAALAAIELRRSAMDAAATP